MNHLRVLLLSTLLLTLSSTWADDSSSDTDTLLTNLGAYIGYDLNTTGPSPTVSTLLDLSTSASYQQYAFISLFGAIPVNAYTSVYSAFVPSGTTDASLNSLSNYTFTTASGNPANYNSTSGGAAGTVSVSTLIDQPTYQPDPVSQAVLNILGTPDYSYCMNNDQTAWLTDCSYLYNSQVISNTVGTLPTPSTFFSYTTNQTVLPQLNSNTLTAPLLYAATDTPPPTGATGLTASNQLQAAANYIRYIGFALNPVDLPNLTQYTNYYTSATSTTASATQYSAQIGLSDYINSLRTYAAQMSLPLSNFYWSLSKRMPQQSSSSSSSLTSQAQSEFQMASRRLVDPSNTDQSTQWIDEINTASSATVQKEIAILLSEINYQMYLSRQLEERILLTNSLTALQTIHQMAPSFTTIMSNASNNATTPTS
jgi:intracellular multiplication protein IcmX